MFNENNRANSFKAPSTLTFNTPRTLTLLGTPYSPRREPQWLGGKEPAWLSSTAGIQSALSQPPTPSFLSARASSDPTPFVTALNTRGPQIAPGLFRAESSALTQHYHSLEFKSQLPSSFAAVDASKKDWRDRLDTITAEATSTLKKVEITLVKNGVKNILRDIAPELATHVGRRVACADAVIDCEQRRQDR